MNDLFEELQKKDGCQYMSDIRSESYLEATIRWVLRMNIWDFNLKQWDDLAYYLFEEKEKFRTMAEVSEYFKKKGRYEK